MSRVLIPTCLLALCLPALCCVNTSYSRAEDGQLTSDLTKVIAGQFPEHSEAFYLHQVDLHTATLKKNPTDVEARNDLAAALLKLKRYEKAEKELLRIEREQPNRYKTHANLGVLYKKTGEYAKAAHHTKKALEIKPEGHLGLGDYYLRMLDWRARVAARESGAAEKNFLGTPYAHGPSATARNPLVDKEHLLTLIKADRHFPHTYLILGDVLFEEDDLQNAARAYLRALAISHEADHKADGFAGSLALDRLSLVTNKWRDRAQSSPDYVFDWAYEGQIQSEFQAAAEWLTEYQRVEAVMLKGGTKKIDFDTVKAEMAQQGYEEPIYEKAGYFKGAIERDRKEFIFSAIFLGGIGLIIVLVAIIIVRAITQRRSVPARA